jgi:hypothetical protein
MKPVPEGSLGLFELFRRPPSIRDAEELADFIDQQAAFLMQKGIYGYSRARAGHYAKILFREQGFQQAVEESRWRAYPLGLAMLAELVEGVLRPHGIDRNRQLDALSALVLRCTLLRHCERRCITHCVLPSCCRRRCVGALCGAQRVPYRACQGSKTPAPVSKRSDKASALVVRVRRAE